MGFELVNFTVKNLGVQIWSNKYSKQDINSISFKFPKLLDEPTGKMKSAFPFIYLFVYLLINLDNPWKAFKPL